MKISRIANAIGHIDDDLISGAAEGRKEKKNPWVKWGSLAACFVVLVIAGAAILPSLLDLNSDSSANRYKNINIQTEEINLVWPWEYRTIYEKYTDIEIDRIEYRGKGRTVSEELLGGSIGTYTIGAYDDNNKKHTIDATVYELQEVAQNQFVAVKMDDDCYVFQNDKYAPPATFGELLEVVNLPKLLELGRFSENGDDPDSNYFTLNSDNALWDILSGCRDAAFVDDQDWSTDNREYISFTLTSEALGAYKCAMYVTVDGYLWTNAFDWQYLFNIGADAAGKIIKYAKENSVKAEYEPYRNSIAGKLVEISEDYILVDDSILCKNPTDGITYKVLLNDLRISRYVDYGVIAVGDIVQISYEGKIDKENGNTIDSAVSVFNAVISDSKSGSVESAEDRTVKNHTVEEPIRINVKDTANKISVTKRALSEITASEEDEYVRLNNGYRFIKPYKDGYIYPVQKSGADGPVEVFFYRDRQGQLSECVDFPRMTYIVHSFDDSIYDLCYEGEGVSIRLWKSGEITDIINTEYSPELTFSEDYIYYTDEDSDEGITYICRTDYEGKEKQKLFALDVCIEQIHLYQDAIWFLYTEFGADYDTMNLGRLDMSSHEIDIYKNLKITDKWLCCDNGFVYFSAHGFKRLNMEDHSVETVYKDEAEEADFVDDNILFYRGKKLYRANNDGIKNIMTAKNDEYINGIEVLDGKIYIETAAGSLWFAIYQIDLEGNIVKKIYGGETSDELNKKIKNGDV